LILVGRFIWNKTYILDDESSPKSSPPVEVTSKNSLLPSKDRCLALSEQQCRRIQAEVDPDGKRAFKDWEFAHQPTLIRLYMAAMSFPQIADAMKHKLTWS
jgi:hypothetical protein